MEKESLTPSESSSAPAPGSTPEKVPNPQASKADHVDGDADTAAADLENKNEEPEFLHGPKLVSVIVSLCLVGKSTHSILIDTFN